MNMETHEQITEKVREKFFPDDKSIKLLRNSEGKNSLVALGKESILILNKPAEAKYVKSLQLNLKDVHTVRHKQLNSKVIVYLNDTHKLVLKKDIGNKLINHIEEGSEAKIIKEDKKWYNNIFGYRTQKPMNMLIASFAYFILIMGVFGAIFDDETEMADTNDSKEATETVADAEDNSNNDNNAVEEEPKPEKEELYVDLDSIDYDIDDEVITIKTETNIPDGTEVYVGMELKGSDKAIDIVPSSEKVEDGKLKVKLGDFESDDEEREYIANGDYVVNASFSTNSDSGTNEHLFDEWGEYDEFVEHYEIDADVRETDDGMVIEKISLGDYEITDAYSEDEIKEKELAEKKDKAETIDYKQLDKNANKHAGKYVTYSGEIVQIMEDSGYTNIRLGLDEYNTDIIFIEYDNETEFVEGDEVTVYGEMVGNYSYESQAGWTIEVPAILADIVE